ncbi:collagenase-like [Anopheles cruzii]|uniref:collagenase-like n=1 Tax=Anopheles cruzii TaxID=68878 RepID=UPI0022EC7AC0|nr:collagenase-like [Anopheles cruzii]
MRNVLVLLGFVAAFGVPKIHAAPQSLVGRPLALPFSVKGPRIRGGIPVGPEEIPYAAGLMIQQSMGSRWCGGSLVSVNYVITAASCFLDPGPTTVLLGASDTTNVADIVVASEIILHQAFVASQNLNDIALVRLARPANITNNIQLARLPNWRQAESLFIGQLATVSGWGALGQNAPELLPLNHLHRLSGTIITNAACNLQFFGGITESHICTATTNGSPCLGDQGGPLTVQDADGGHTVIGVFSFVSNLGCDVDWPAVYTRVTRYLSWIEANSDVIIRTDFDFLPTPPNLITTTVATPEPTHQETTTTSVFTTTTVTPEPTHQDTTTTSVFTTTAVTPEPTHQETTTTSVFTTTTVTPEPTHQDTTPTTLS